MADVDLRAQLRHSGRHAVRELRDQQMVPAVVYGQGIATEPVAVNNRELHKALVRAGTGLITLHVGEREPLKVLAREVQHHPYKHHVQHVDFQAVSMTETLHVRVPILLEGSSPVLARAGMILIHNIEAIEVECLPNDIPQHLTASLDKLQSEDDSIFVRDLAVPERVKLLVDGNHVVASVAISRAEVEAEAPAEGQAAAEPEVVAKGKPKEEEGEAETR
jgi:large subunit ribosomal protein L25